MRFLLPLLTIALLLAACAPATPAPTPTPEEVKPAPAKVEPTPTPAPYPVVPSGFGIYEPYPVTVQPSLPSYEIELGAVANADLLAALNEEQKALLEQNGFVVVPSRIPQIYEVYKRAKEEGIPIFVTTDALLHTFHIIYNYALRLIEMEHFVQDLKGLNQAMVEAALEQYANASGKVREAAKRNVAFFAVAAKLLDPDFAVPDEVANLVEKELALIEAHQGFAASPIFGYREDYSQYVPRGHYTRNETFQRYFKAMMWYGRMMFRLRPGATPEAIEAGRMETRQAILFAESGGGGQAGAGGVGAHLRAHRFLRGQDR